MFEDGAPIPIGGEGEETEAKLAPQASLHRLNRLEYNNTIQDLLGVDLEPANNFPPDASVEGFDNISSALTVTPSLLDNYVEAARVAVEDAFATRPVFSSMLEEDDPRWTYSINRADNTIGGIVRLRGGRADATVSLNEAGQYRVIIRAQGYINGGAATPRMRLSVAGQDFDFDLPGTMQDMVYTLEAVPGSHSVSMAALNFEEDAPANRGNDIMVDWVRIETLAERRGPAYEYFVTCEFAQDGCALETLLSFAEKAWRRPLNETERAKIRGLFDTFLRHGETPEDALKLGLRAILTSPKFLFRYRTVEDANSTELLDPWVLASRLSYFIWSSTPDDRLLDAAADGTLSSPSGVKETVGWMLKDPKAQALADGFAEQWLDLRHLEQASPSTETYPTFNEDVREAMMQESKLFFLDYLERPNAIATMLEPGFAWRNISLSQHLGVAAPEGDGFVRTDVSADERSGVLELSAWLTARSDTDHSSPIKRGSFIADQMLCSPVPPPPPGLEIGQLLEASSGLSMRERLEMHRNDPACSSCHLYLDVLGMGFEVYDGAGRWVDDPNLDSRGELPGLGDFRGAKEMVAMVDREDFVMCVSKKLLTYAIGRKPTQADIEAMSADGEILTTTMSDLITAIVLSPAFSHPVELK